MSLLLHLVPVGMVVYFGVALSVDPAEFAIRSSSHAPLDLSCVRRETPVDFVRPAPEPASLVLPEPAEEVEREPAAEEVPAPRLAPAEAPAPVLDRPLRAGVETLRRPEPPPAAEEQLPSVESETLPLQVHNPPPEYPLSARRRRLEGEVVVEVVVLEDGRAGDARVVGSSDVPAFAEAALRAVKDWTFQPATRAGRPVRSVERVRFVFKLAGR